MTTLNKSKTDHVRKTLDKIGEGYLPEDVVENLLEEHDCTMNELMLMLLPVAKEYAVAPISKFKVGTVALGESGNLYFGANQELSEVSLTQVIHSEQSVIANAHRLEETAITKIAITERPCGHCRQFLLELDNAKDVEILLTTSLPTKLTDLMPDAFDTSALGVQSGMLEYHEHPLNFTEGDSDDITEQALVAAQHSYAPYTKAYAGAALQTKDGQVYAASYLESVAFNPSLGAMQAALASLVMSGHTHEDITDAALVHVRDSVINHVETTKMVLKSVRPDLKLKVSEVA